MLQSSGFLLWTVWLVPWWSWPKTCEGFIQEGVPLLGWMEDLRARFGGSLSHPILRGWPTVI